MPDLSFLWSIFQVAFGIGLVIFVHELGHFLAARWAGVRVETFSLGFGRPIFGWRRGHTLYQIGWVPLGGFVKMAGEEPEGPDAELQPYELGAKTVGQRFLIFSGGVIMNVVFGLVVFPAILMVGVPFGEPLLGEAGPGSPAWKAGLQAGSRVLTVNDKEIYAFSQIPLAVALGSSEECVLELIEPGGVQPVTVRLQPEPDESMGIHRIGVQHPLDTEWAVSVEEGSVAAKAGLETGDRLLAITGGQEGLSLRMQYELALTRREELRATFQHGEDTLDVTLPLVEGEELKVKLIGISPLQNVIFALREGPGVTALGLEESDRILEVNGRPVYSPPDFLEALLAAREGFVLHVDRDDRRLELRSGALSEAEVVRLWENVALRGDNDTPRVQVTAGGAAHAAGLRTGDWVLEVDGTSVKDCQPGILQPVRESARAGEPIRLSVKRPGVEPTFHEYTLEARPARPVSYGFAPQRAEYIYQVSDPLQALQVGFTSCLDMLKDVWLTLKGIASQDVGGENVGGIITIGAAAHDFASAGWAKFFYFLCILSMNLAFLNVLPIPVLDGGHLIFLLIEKLKGSPVSERVMGYSNLVGLVLILSLFVYVMHNDIQRFFFR